MRRLGAQRAAEVGVAVRGRRAERDRLLRAGRGVVLQQADVALGAAGAGLARDLLLHQHDVDVRVGLHGVDRIDVVVGTGQHAIAAVGRISHQRADAEDRVQLLRRRRLQRAEMQAVPLGAVEQQAAECARQCDGAEIASAGRAGIGEQLRHLHDIVERIGAHHAGLARHRIERFNRSRERAGVRQRCFPAAFRLAELERNDVLAGGARHAARRLERLEVGHGLDIDHDHLQLRLVGEEGDVIADREAGLVPAGDEIFRDDAALIQGAVGEQHHAAALSHHRDRAFLHRQHAIFGEGDEAGFRADIAHAVRARHREAGFGDHRGELAPETGGLGVIGFAEARREHRGAARACRRAGAQRLGHAGRRHQHHQMIGRLRQRLEIGIAGLVPDRVAARIDRIDRTGELILVQVAPDPRGPAAGTIAGADQHRVARCGERFDLFLGFFQVHATVLSVIPDTSSVCASL